MIGTVYVVTDAHAPHSVLDQATAAALGGAWAVQLRDKDMAEADFRSLAQALLAALAPHRVKLFINDRIDAAIAVGAQGLHIGQSDGDPAAVRARIGPQMMLGLSIENLAQCDAIPPACVDYIGAGPVHATTTKPDHAPPIGIKGLHRIVRAAPCPVIAIGGIGAEDVTALKQSGAAGMAVVSAVSRASTPQAATRHLCDLWGQI